MSKLFILCGPPGAGKSTWAKEHFNASSIVSRDEIRFSFLTDDSEYFDKESAVWDFFIDAIQLHLNDGADVVADATHINKNSRSKLINALRLNDEVEVIPIFFDICQAVCMDRNGRRNGRAYVPKSVIRRMGAQFSIPTFGENERFTEIWRVDAQNNLTKTKRG